MLICGVVWCVIGNDSRVGDVGVNAEEENNMLVIDKDEVDSFNMIVKPGEEIPDTPEVPK